MESKLILILLIVIITLFNLTPVFAADTKANILFDAGHAEDAGNADWVIQGAYSDFATLLKKHGFNVSDTRDKLTEGQLKKYDALVIAEPNSVFAPEEQRAIIEFIASGGGVFFIGNHIESDRNRNGIDSVGVFNQFVGELGFTFENVNFLRANLSAEPVNGEYIEHPVTYKVKAMAIWSGTSIKIHDPKRVQGLIMFSKWLYGQPALAVGTHVLGRFVIVGDSAIFDDGSGTNPMENLHKGFIEFDHQQLALNAINWLTEQPNEDY